LLEWGVIDEMVEADRLLERARKLASFYASKSPVACQMIKRSVNAISSALDQSIMHMDFDQNMLNQFSDDRVEAGRAYLEKREAKFTGN